jgi:hypothetical protein
MEVGDAVRIIDPGQVYSTYDAMAYAMNLPNWVSGTQAHIYEGNIFTILDRKPHPESASNIICGIDNGNISIVIDTGGLELVRRSPLTDRRKRSEEYWKAREKIGV